MERSGAGKPAREYFNKTSCRHYFIYKQNAF